MGMEPVHAFVIYKGPLDGNVFQEGISFGDRGKGEEHGKIKKGEGLEGSVNPGICHIAVGQEADG